MEKKQNGIQTEKKKKRSQIIFQRNSKTTLRGKKLTKQNLIAEF